MFISTFTKGTEGFDDDARAFELILDTTDADSNSPRGCSSFDYWTCIQVGSYLDLLEQESRFKDSKDSVGPRDLLVCS